MDPIVGQIILFGGNFAPRGWAFCDGQELDIAEHEALFAILGTTYGGDGRTRFCLPDLRGRVPIHAGAAPDLTARTLGDAIGSECVSLTAAQLPEHRHEMQVADTDATDDRATQDSTLGRARIYVNADASTHLQKSVPKAPLDSTTIGLAGESAPHQNLQPSLCLHYIIATTGALPSRH